MPQTWLRPNRRALMLGMILPALATAGGALLVAGYGNGLAGSWSRALGALLVVGGGALLLGLVVQLSRPRVSCANQHVLFYLRNGAPITTPIEVVEGFFLGQGPAHLGQSAAGETETVNLVARLAQRATEWHHVEVKSALGQWSDGYVTIRGTWTEPLTEDLVRQLNRQLAKAKRKS